VWSDYNPDVFNPATGTFGPSHRTSISQLQLSPTFLDSKLVFDPSGAAGIGNGFYSLRDTPTFDSGIDPQFTGTVLGAVSELTFTPANPAGTSRGAAIFAAGSSNAPNRGPLVKIFDELG